MNAARFLRSIAHTRPSQLRERLRRILRNLAHDWRLAGTARARTTDAPQLATQIPRPLFRARTDRFDATDGPHARFLGVRRPLTVPVDWDALDAPELERMNLHYMEFLEAVDDDAFTALVDDWIEHNPLAARGSWRIGWNSFVVSLRSVVWMQELERRAERLDPSFRERCARSLAQQLGFLESHLELDIGGNHLIKNAKALLWASRVFTGHDARRWGARATEMLRTELDEQILADGVHYERSPAYHVQVFADVLECAHVAGDELRRELERRLEPMAQALVDLTHPDGCPSLFNDGGLHMTYAPEECLGLYERSFGRARPTPREVFVLEQAGYFGARHGDSLILVDCGRLAPDHLPAHGHGDVLAFEWTIGGRRFVVDAGVFEYERGELRDLSRSTAVHNTITIDNGDQAEFWAAFRVGRRPRVRLERYELLGRGFVLEGSHDGYAHLAGAPIHQRRFIIGRDSLVIDDSVDGGMRQSVSARLLLHPDVAVTTFGRHGVHMRHGNVSVVLESRHPLSVVEAEWWPNFGVRQATKRIVVHASPAPCRSSIRMHRITQSSSTAAFIPGAAVPVASPRR